MLPGSKFRILWIGDEDGWSASDFGKRVFKKGKTITIIKTTGGKFLGAYMGFPIDPKGKSSGGHKSFIFYQRHNKMYKLANKPGKDEIYQLAKEPLHMSYGLHLHPGCKSNYVSNLGLATYGDYYLPKAAAANNYVSGFYVLGKTDTKKGTDSIRVHFKCKYAETYLVY